MDVLNIIQASGGITLRMVGDTVAQVGGDFWYYPLLPDKTLIAERHKLEPAYVEFIALNKAELAKRGRYLGVWLNPISNQYYFDINVRAKTKKQALEHIGQINKVSQRQILAAFNTVWGETARVIDKNEQNVP